METQVCPGCKGTGWVREPNAIVPKLTPCTWCRGKRKIPVLNNDGRWAKASR